MNQMAENSMLLPRREAFPREDRADTLLCDAMNWRNTEWLNHADVRATLADLAHGVLTAKTAEEAGVAAHGILEAVIESWADEEARAES